MLDDGVEGSDSDNVLGNAGTCRCLPNARLDAVFFLGTFSGEGGTRSSIGLPLLRFCSDLLALREQGDNKTDGISRMFLFKRNRLFSSTLGSSKIIS